MASECKALLAKFGLELDPLKTVSSLTIPEQQCVEIARVLTIDPDILIIDEIDKLPNSCNVKNDLSEFS